MDKLSVFELLQICKEYSIKIYSFATKKDLIKRIVLSQQYKKKLLLNNIKSYNIKSNIIINTFNINLPQEILQILQKNNKLIQQEFYISINKNYKNDKQGFIYGFKYSTDNNTLDKFWLKIG